MNKAYFYIVFFFLSAAYANFDLKQKIIIITSRGGGGHLSAAKAIEYYFKDLYNIKSTILLEDLLYSADFIQQLTFGKYSFEDLYNYFLHQRLNFLINLVGSRSHWYINAYTNKIENLIKNYLIKEKPDLVLSVIPLFGQQLLNACKNLNIPFIIITVDLDTTNYISGLTAPTDKNYKNFVYTLPFEDKQIRQKVKDLKVLPEQIKISGFPIRADFFEPKNKALIKKDFNLPDNKPIIFILMGATGSEACIYYLKKLAEINLFAHVIICTGRDKTLKTRLEKINLPESLTITIMGFTDRISDLMAISDTIITKPGPTTISEALYTGVPIIIDYTASPVFWEKLNIDFIEKNKLGTAISDLNKLPDILTKYLDKNYNFIIKNRISNFKKEDPRETLKNIIANTIN